MPLLKNVFRKLPHLIELESCEKKLDEKEATIKDEIIESKDDSEAIANINLMLDKFNRRL